MNIVIIDNYDSFTYNLHHLVKESEKNVEVIRNDKFQISELEKYDKIILSPGPGIPCEAGLLLNVIQHYADKKPILGICLGAQAIGEAFGGELKNLSEVFHGIQTPVSLLGNDYLFQGLPDAILVGRYHSWVVDNQSLPPCLEITSLSNEGQIMSLRHCRYDIRGIQFHPESILTPDGKTIISNWINH